MDLVCFAWSLNIIIKLSFDFVFFVIYLCGIIAQNALNIGVGIVACGVCGEQGGFVPRDFVSVARVWIVGSRWWCLSLEAWRESTRISFVFLLDKLIFFLYNPAFTKSRAFRFCSVAGLAQLVEQLPCKQQVGGSSPLTSSIQTLYRLFLFQCLTSFPRSLLVRYSSGQRGQTVNLLTLSSVVRIHVSPPLD